VQQHQQQDWLPEVLCLYRHVITFEHT
jgi:hypothetical protein